MMTYQEMDARMEELLDGVNKAFPNTMSGIFGDTEEGLELFFEGGKALDSKYAYSVIIDETDGAFILTVSQRTERDAPYDEFRVVDERRYKTLTRLLKYVTRWNDENTW